MEHTITHTEPINTIQNFLLILNLILPTQTTMSLEKKISQNKKKPKPSLRLLRRAFFSCADVAKRFEQNCCQSFCMMLLCTRFKTQ
jgi:hypothetical protein